MTRYLLFLFALLALGIAACTPLAPSRALAAPIAVAATVAAPTRTAVGTTTSATGSSLPQPTVTPTTPFDPGPSFSDPAATNSHRALEQVAGIIYEAWADKQDLKPYLEGVMTAFDVPPLGEGDVALAESRYQQGLPLFFLPQIAEMADAFDDGFVSLDSFITAANEQGAKQKGTDQPLTREYLTQQFGAYAGKAQYEEGQVLPPFVLALSRERAKRLPARQPDSLWGDGLLDPLQLTLLLYGVSFAGADTSPIPLARSGSSIQRNIIWNEVSAPRPELGVPNATDGDPIVGWIKGKLRGKVKSAIQDAVGIPLDKKAAAQASLCASLILFGHKLTATTTPNLLYHRDGSKPSVTRAEVTLTFQDDYWDNYLSTDRWLIQALAKCELPRRGEVEGAELEWEVTESLADHGSFDLTQAHTDDKGRAWASWRTVPETTPENQRTFYNQRDAVGAIIVRAGGLVPRWSGLERAVNLLRDTGETGDAGLTVIYYEAPHYRVDQIVADGRGRLTGSVCSLDKPFTLKVAGSNAAGGPYEGKFKFAPKDTKGGSWTHLATTTCIMAFGCGTVTASGTYQAEDAAGGKLVITMNDTTQVAAMPGGGGPSLMPGWQFTFEPFGGDCSGE